MATSEQPAKPAASDVAARPPRRAPRSKVSTALSPGAPNGAPNGARPAVAMLGERNAVLIEVNLAGPWTRRQVLDVHFPRFYDTWRRGRRRARDVRGRPALRIGDKYLRVALAPDEITDLVAADERDNEHPLIHRVWADYVLHAHIDRSTRTVKADAAGRVFSADGAGITWAVLDSGIHREHPHFATHNTFADTEQLCADFTYLTDDQTQPDGHETQPWGTPFQDDVGHGTHVAGIIAGGLPDDAEAVVLQTHDDDVTGAPVSSIRRDHGRLAGIAPMTRLISIKVLAPDGSGQARTTSSALIQALRYVRHELNSDGDPSCVQGVNMSLGCRWDPADYAAGQSPVCQAVNQLVDSGVVVVVSAGNEGYAGERQDDTRGHGVMSSITDPANAELAVTVGATHRDHPHTYGIWYQSSKGPTWDGRAKPDLVAPGEAVCSAAAPSLPTRASASATLSPLLADSTAAVYAEDSGTSMAAPHVSGAIAGFLSVRREFIGQPREVKARFSAAATDLGRDRFYQGHGLLDALRVLDDC